MKEKDYIDEFLEYQDKQYLPETNYPPNGRLPRYLREGDRKPWRMAFLYFLSVPVCVLAVVFVVKKYAEYGERVILILVLLLLAMLALNVLIVVNYIRKGIRARAAAAKQTGRNVRRTVVDVEHNPERPHQIHQIMEVSTMKLGCVTLDCGNADELADFYQKLLGFTIRFTNTDEGLKFVGIVSESTGMTLLFQEDNDYIPPVWPSQPGQQQTMAHLDFHTDDLEKDVRHAIACGAKPADTQYSDKWRVMLDPAGHPFCIEKLP